MMLMPDPSTAVLDPFAAQPLADPRSATSRARHRPALRPRPALDRQEGRGLPAESTGIGDTAYFGPEAEFFVFDDVRFEVGDEQGRVYEIDSEEGPYITGEELRATATWATVRRSRAATSRCRRSTAAQDLRAEMLTVHGRHGPRDREAPPRGGARQHELGIKFATLVQGRRQHADLQVRRAQRRATSTARRRRSCRSRSRATTARACTCHQSIWKDGKPLFAGNRLRRPVGDVRSTTSAASSSTPRRSTPSPTRRPTATSA